MEKSKIGWLNGGNTFNPWIGCSPVSEACRNCYAKRETARFKMTPCFNTYRKVTSVSYWRRPLAWNRASDPEAPTLVFCGSLFGAAQGGGRLVFRRETVPGGVRDRPVKKNGRWPSTARALFPPFHGCFFGSSPPRRFTSRTAAAVTTAAMLSSGSRTASTASRMRRSILTVANSFAVRPSYRERAAARRWASAALERV
jgi:hypothetical protein